MLVLARRENGSSGNGWVDEWMPESANAISPSVCCRVHKTRTHGMTYQVSMAVSRIWYTTWLPAPPKSLRHVPDSHFMVICSLTSILHFPTRLH